MPAPGSKKHANKRTDMQRAVDLAFVERLHIRGLTIAQIADALAKERPYVLSKNQIQYDLASLDEMWLARAVAERDKMKRREMAGLDEMERELWEAFEKSKKETIKQVVEQTGKGKHRGTKQRIEKELKHGDPSYMRLILEVKQRRAKLCGLDTAEKFEHTGADGEPLFSPDPLEALERVYGPDQAKAAKGIVGAIRN